MRSWLLLLVVATAGCRPAALLTGRVLGGGIAAAQRNDYREDPERPVPESCPEKPTACLGNQVVAYTSRGVVWRDGNPFCDYAERILEDCGTGYCRLESNTCIQPCAGMARPEPDACTADGLAVVTKVWMAGGPTAASCKLETRTVPCPTGCDPASARCREATP